MSNIPKIKIILGSTRPNRFGPTPAAWVYGIAKSRTDAHFEIVDLKDVNLPFLDEGVPPSVSLGNYANEHTKAWAKTIGEADGFVMIPAEYNHSINAALTNAISYLFAEWNYKPVSYVSYGGAGGGIRAVEHLRAIAGELHMFDLREAIHFTNYWTNFNDKGEFLTTPEQAQLVSGMLDRLVFWANQMKRARAELK